VLACGALCFSRFFHPTGPSWLDSWTLLQNVAAHPMVFILLQAETFRGEALKNGI
jgi:hypothetical protein